MLVTLVTNSTSSQLKKQFFSDKLGPSLSTQNWECKDGETWSLHPVMRDTGNQGSSNLGPVLCRRDIEEKKNADPRSSILCLDAFFWAKLPVPQSPTKVNARHLQAALWVFALPGFYREAAFARPSPVWPDARITGSQAEAAAWRVDFELSADLKVVLHIKTYKG